MRIDIPYGKGFQTVDVADKNLLGVYSPKDGDVTVSQEKLIEDALCSPIQSRPLSELAKDAESVVIITSDHTRPLPSRLTMPRLLARIRKGNPGAKITILVASGCHRAMTDREMRDRFGEEIVNNEKIVIHNSFDREQLVKIGTLPSGGELTVNRLAVEADLLIAEGFIEPHFFAGFSGGRKAVLPGISAAGTVRYNHNAQFIDHPEAKAGHLAGNPIHEDMCSAARQCGLKFILNVVLDPQKRVIGAVAGDPFAAHEKGCEICAEHAQLPEIKADIVISSNGGYPLDQNLYQAVKGMTTASDCCRDGGVIILCASCMDGHGGEAFYRELAQAQSPEELLSRIRKVAKEDTPADQWQYQILCRILEKHTVMLISQMDPEAVKKVKLHPYKNVQQALEEAKNQLGEDARVAVIPDSVSVFAM